MARRRDQASPGGQVASGALVDTLYDRIVGMLLDKRIAPGSPLRTEALAAELGVSATPVRETLARLETTGLVERSARRGWRAAQLLTHRDQVEVIELRLLLEPENARQACARASEDTVRELRRLVLQQSAAAVGPGYERYREYLQADWNFHLLIASSTENAYLEKAFGTISGYLQRFQLFATNVITDATECTSEHDAILEAFERHSPEIAGAAMRDHLTRLRERVAAQSS